MRKIIPAFFFLVIALMFCTQVYAADFTAFRKYPHLIHAGYTDCSGEKKPSMMILWHASMDDKAGIRFDVKDASGNVMRDASGNIVYGEEIEVNGDKKPVCCKTSQCSCDTPMDGYLFQYTKDCLMPESVTYYMVKLSSDQKNPFKASFKAAPLDDASRNLTFYGLGDTRADTDGNPENYVGVVTQMLKDISENRSLRNTLCIHDGDFAMDGQNEHDKDGLDYWDREFFNPAPRTGWSQDVVKFLGHVPVMGVAGNHEGYFYQDGKKYTDYKNFGQRFKAYFPYPFYHGGPNRLYYSFDYGPVHFAMVDTNNRNSGSKGQGKDDESGYNAQFASLAPKESGDGQYEWLKNDILNSGKKWNIVVLHNPLFSASGLRDRFKKNIAIRDGLHNLLANELKGKVKLVIQGHDHYYARSVKDGITYLLLGTGGANTGGKAVGLDESYRPPSASHPEVKTACDNDCGPGKNIPCFHFARFDIVAGSMDVTVKYANKETSGNIETFNISLDK